MNLDQWTIGENSLNKQRWNLHRDTYVLFMLKSLSIKKSNSCFPGKLFKVKSGY